MLILALLPACAACRALRARCCERVAAAAQGRVRVPPRLPRARPPIPSQTRPTLPAPTSSKCLQVLQYMLRVVPLDRAPAAADTPLLPRLGCAGLGALGRAGSAGGLGWERRWAGRWAGSAGRPGSCWATARGGARSAVCCRTRSTASTRASPRRPSPSPRATGARSALLQGDDNDLRAAALAVAQQLAADTEALRAMQQPVRWAGRAGLLPPRRQAGCCRRRCAAWGDAAAASAAVGPRAPVQPIPHAACPRPAFCPPQASGFPEALQALQVRLDTLPREDWGSVEEEAAAARQLAEALQRDLPPPPPPAAAGAQRAPPAAVVDDSSTTGAPAASLQLVAVPSGEQAQQQPN